jgi:hypothetical protein
VRLQEISIPSDSPLTIVVGVAYAADSRGLVFEASGSEPPLRASERSFRSEKKYITKRRFGTRSVRCGRPEKTSRSNCFLQMLNVY